MARPRRTADLDARSSAARLESLQLRPTRQGWVPDLGDVGAVGAVGEPVVRPEPLLVPGMAGSPAEQPPLRPPGPGELLREWARDRTPLWCHSTLDRATPGSVAVTVAAVVAALIAVVMLLHKPGPAGDPSYDLSAASTTAGPSSYVSPTVAPDPVASDTASIVVDIGGRVKKPGLVTLPTGARVADAIAAAGGPLHHRELATTNLAARVTDGQLLLVGTKSATAAPAAADGSSPTTPSSAAPVDLNSATLEVLETLPGVGPVTGQKILDWRTAHSGFTSVEQLQQVSGIGPATYAELSPLVTP